MNRYAVSALLIASHHMTSATRLPQQFAFLLQKLS